MMSRQLQWITVALSLTATFTWPTSVKAEPQGHHHGCACRDCAKHSYYWQNYQRPWGRNCLGTTPCGTDMSCSPQGPFFGYFPTCWNRWPAAWQNCPVEPWEDRHVTHMEMIREEVLMPAPDPEEPSPIPPVVPPAIPRFDGPMPKGTAPRGNSASLPPATALGASRSQPLHTKLFGPPKSSRQRLVVTPLPKISPENSTVANLVPKKKETLANRPAAAGRSPAARRPAVEHVPYPLSENVQADHQEFRTRSASLPRPGEKQPGKATRAVHGSKSAAVVLVPVSYPSLVGTLQSMEDDSDPEFEYANRLRDGR